MIIDTTFCDKTNYIYSDSDAVFHQFPGLNLLKFTFYLKKRLGLDMICNSSLIRKAVIFDVLYLPKCRPSYLC